MAVFDMGRNISPIPTPLETKMRDEAEAFRRWAENVPLQVSDAVPPGTIHFLPSEVKQALDAAEESVDQAFEALLIYCLAHRFYGKFWPYLTEKLARTVERKFEAIVTTRMAALRVISENAKRIGVITNIGTGESEEQ